MRFKIMAGGQSKWVGIIFGAMTLDCTERRGLCFIPSEHTHVMSALGISMQRLEGPAHEKYHADGMYGAVMEKIRVLGVRNSVPDVRATATMTQRRIGWQAHTLPPASVTMIAKLRAPQALV